MPSTYDSIGTQYTGKKNLHKVYGECEYCHAQTMLSSYDTVKYFVILHIPLIPLGKVRVLNECAACNRHTFLKQKDWDDAKAQAIVNALTRFKAEPENPEAIRGAIATAVGYQDLPLFQATIQELGTQWKRDHDVQVDIAEGQRFFGNLEAAEAAFRNALAAKDDPNVRVRAAAVQIRLGRPEQAEPLLSHLTSPETGGGSILWMLAKGYQSQGMHTEALATLDRFAKVVPTAVTDKAFIELRKLSEKNISTGKKIKDPSLAKSEAAYQSASLGSRLAPFVGPIFGSVLLVWYLWSAVHYGRNCKVYVLNGLKVPYVAQINDQEVKLAQGSRTSIRISEGEVTISGKGTGFEIPKSTVSISTNFFLRPFTNPVFVINPDINAVLVDEMTYYAAPGKQPPNGTQEISAAKVLHSFSGRDYVFESFPPTLKIKEGSQTSKTRVDQFPTSSMDLLEIFALSQSGLSEEENRERMLQWLTIRHQSEPEDEMLAGMFERFYPEDAPKIFDGQLSQRPAKILLHRLYQDRKRKNDPQHDLEAEYAKLLEAEPQSGELAYLAGRVASSPKQRATLLEKAASLDPPVAHALAAIGFQLMSEGKYVEALEKVQAAIDLKPKSVQFQFMRNRCFFALQKYTDVIDWARTTKLGAIAGARVFMEESSAIAQAGGQEDGLSELQGRVRLQTEIMGAEMFESYWAAGKGTYDYARRGTTADSLAKAAEQDIQEVRDGVDGSEESATDHLFLYVVESIAGNAQQSQSHRESAIAELNKGDSDAKSLAKSLASEQAPNFEEMSVLTETCENKRVWMAALAIRFPDRATDYKNMVAKLNFERKAPYWWLLNWTNQQ